MIWLIFLISIKYYTVWVPATRAEKHPTLVN